MLKDTADGDGVAELAAQSAAERPIGDLSADELRTIFARELLGIERTIRGAIGDLTCKSVLEVRVDLAQLSYDVRALREQVQP